MKTLGNEKGSVIVFVTLMIVLLLIMVGMGLDTGQVTYVRSQGQAAVDASALAAVSGLPSRNTVQVQNRAAGFNSTNDYVESPTNPIGNSNISYVEYDFSTNTITNYAANINTANGVRVALEQATGSGITTPVFLTPLLNLLGFSTAATADINVSSVAVIQAKPAIPIALWSGVCPGAGDPDPKEVKIQMQHPDQKSNGEENSCWTTFLDCSSGAPDIKAGFTTAKTCSGGKITGEIGIDVPPGICQNRGSVTTVMQTAEDFWNATKNTLEWWLVPVIEGGGNCAASNPTLIKNWAKIKPIAFQKQGYPKYIEAWVTCGENLIDEGFDSSLCFSYRLVREPAKGM